ncbi:MAG TPA: metallophosphoesterase [Alphaproteobacteria bacterium]|nr:metallophosphoesterase [Alphaproteobacteria bacterium]
MPIHLPPITRRQFLVRTLTAAAGLALAPRLFAAEKQTDNDFWALLSDTHIAADRKRFAHGCNMTDHLETVTRDLLAQPTLAAGVFVTGDCAYDDGETGDYATFANLLGPLGANGMPLHLTLGNHDNRERFWDALTAERTAKRPLEDKQAMMLPSRRVNWFMLDSLERTRYTPGMVGPEQLDWLAGALDANPAKPALVMVHHDPGLLGKVGGLRDTKALFKVIRPRKQVKAVIYGHTHDWHVHEHDSGIHLINLPPTAYVFEDGKPSGWVRATVEDDRMHIELRCVDPKHRLNGETRTLNWRV